MAKRDLVKRFTYSTTAIDEFYDVDQTTAPRNPGKPAGLWYSCGNSWLNWLSREMPEWYENIRYQYELVIDFSEILIIRTFDELLEFTRAYGIKHSFGQGYPEIDFARVAQDYKGIEICPYIWKGRNHPTTNWYYGWDVASGCIWDVSAIREATEEEFQKKAEDHQADDEEDYIYGKYESPYKKQTPKLEMNKTIRDLLGRLREPGDYQLNELANRFADYLKASPILGFLSVITYDFLLENIEDAVILAFVPDITVQHGTFTVQEKEISFGKKVKKTGKTLTRKKRVTLKTTVEFDFYPINYDNNAIAEVGITTQFGKANRVQRVFPLTPQGIEKALVFLKSWGDKVSGFLPQKNSEILEILAKEFDVLLEKDRYKVIPQYQESVQWKNGSPQRKQGAIKSLTVVGIQNGSPIRGSNSAIDSAAIRLVLSDEDNQISFEGIVPEEVVVETYQKKKPNSIGGYESVTEKRVVGQRKISKGGSLITSIDRWIAEADKILEELSTPIQSNPRRNPLLTNPDQRTIDLRAKYRAKYGGDWWQDQKIKDAYDAEKKEIYRGDIRSQAKKPLTKRKSTQKDSGVQITIMFDGRSTVLQEGSDLFNEYMEWFLNTEMKSSKPKSKKKTKK